MSISGEISEAMLADLFEEPSGAVRAAARPWQHRTWWTVTAGRGRSEAA